MNESIAAFDHRMDNLRDQIDESLGQSIRFPPGCPDRLAEAIHYSLLAPGKRLRPILVLLAADACGSSLETAMPAACAVEMVHAYSLIHDDLPAMDDDDLRRGRPTCHRAFDEATAILAGDALLTRAFDILASQSLTPDIAARSCQALAQAAGAAGMVGGQADDLAAEGNAADEQWLESIHRRKTGAMLEVSLKLGATAAQATDEQLQQLVSYGSCLGLAFQIVDDLLDLTGDAEQTGKTGGKDTEHNKMTFPSVWGIEYSRQRAADLIDHATLHLEMFRSRADDLEALARFVLRRNR